MGLKDYGGCLFILIALCGFIYLMFQIDYSKPLSKEDQEYLEFQHIMKPYRRR